MPAILLSLQYGVYGRPRRQLLRFQYSAMLIVLSDLHTSRQAFMYLATAADLTQHPLSTC